MTVEIPRGQEQTITFNVGPDEGSALITRNGQTMHIDLKQIELVELGVPFALPETQGTFRNGINPYILAVMALAILSFIFYILGEKEIKTRKAGREI